MSRPFKFREGRDCAKDRTAAKSAYSIHSTTLSTTRNGTDRPTATSSAAALVGLGAVIGCFFALRPMRHS